MKIYLQYPWRFPDSPYYKYLVESPPEGAEFLNTEKERGVITNKRFFWFSNFLKRNIRRWTKWFRLAIPNAHLSPKGDYDLIHCCHCLSKNLDKPWVCDIEMVPSFAISGIDSERGRRKVREILMRDNCKKILPWCEAAKKDILRVFPEVENKIKVVYPAVPVVENLKKPKNKWLRVIFVARYFDIKGGLIALETMERLRRKFGVEGIVVADVSGELRKKYSKLKIYDLMPHEKLCGLLRDSDIFLYPSAMDTFGFSILEAWSFGLPVVTINTKYTASRREMVEDGKTGFIFDVEGDIDFERIGKKEGEIVERLVGDVSKFALDEKLLGKIRKNCLKEINDGKFSVGKRNGELKRVYGEAVR